MPQRKDSGSGVGREQHREKERGVPYGAWASWAAGGGGAGGASRTEAPALLIPSPISALRDAGHIIIQVACGAHHSLFLSQAGVVLSCGSNMHGQLGQVASSKPPTPLSNDPSAGSSNNVSSSRASSSGVPDVSGIAAVALSQRALYIAAGARTSAAIVASGRRYEHISVAFTHRASTGTAWNQYGIRMILAWFNEIDIKLSTDAGMPTTRRNLL